MNTPKISIITPSYNQHDYIEDCILSVLNQDARCEIEHIIIDGGSNDGTLSILRKYPHLIWISESDEGQSDAINKGLLRASGDIIGWLNSDDRYLLNTFSRVLDELKDNTIAGIYSNCHFIDKVGNRTQDLISHRPYKFMALFHCFIPSTTFFFKRNVIDSGLFIDKSFNQTMDRDFFCRILYSGFKLKYVNTFFAEFRWHDSNKSLNTFSTKIESAGEGIRLLNKIYSLKIPERIPYIWVYFGIDRSLNIVRKLIKITSNYYE